MKHRYKAKKASILSYLASGALLLAGHVAADVSGEWQGNLDVGPQTIPLVLHLEQIEGDWQGTLDSPSQGGFDMPMTQVEFENDQLMFEMDSLRIHYEGKYNSTDETLTGTFIQGQSFKLNFSRPEAKEIASNATMDEIVGTWSGNIQTAAGPLMFVVHVELVNGQLIASADSPDQGANGLTVDSVHFNQGELVFKMKDIGAHYKGQLIADKSAIHGKFEQSGAVMQLNLDKTPLTDKISARPQTPTAPFPYDTEEVVVNNQEANIDLAGTLTKPSSGKIRATAVMITGSGSQDRDETLFRHKPFAVIADHLTRQGYAVLRLDDRGTGQSSGDFETATSADFVTDISAAVDYLKRRQDIPNKTIGLIGHSEGGMIAPMVAAQRDDIAFLVLLAGPGVKITDLYIEQRQRLLASMGMSEDVLKKIKKYDTITFEKINRLPEGATEDKSILAAVKQTLGVMGIPDQELLNKQAQQLMSTWTSPWFRYFLKFHPQQYLTQVDAPLLAINGQLDLQVTAEENLNGIKKSLSSSGHKDFKTVELERLNHLFQTAETGAISEYSAIEETIAPVALNTISHWLNQRF